MESAVELVAGNGAYRRGRDGIWRYAVGADDPVPGARDLSLLEIYWSLKVSGGPPPRFAVPAAWIRTRPELSFCRGHLLAAGDPESGLVEVPVEEFTAADSVIGIVAPELMPAALLTTRAVAALLDIAERSVNRYVATNRIVPAVAVVSDAPVWSLPVLRRWQDHGRGGLTGRRGRPPRT